MNSPTTPNNPFPRKIANTTQKGESPVDSPSIFGPIILPSTCCKIMINSKNITPFDGLSSMMSMVLGMAPMYGPKNGMTLVTPTITLTSATYGMRSIRQHTKQIAPIMSESMILPLIKPPNILSLSFKMLESTCIWRSDRNALTSFLVWRLKVSLLRRT